MDLSLENAANPTYYMLNFLTKLIENGTDGDLYYFDLAKVFDSVSHNRLSISGNLSLWIRNFLTHRRQQVRENSTLSNCYPEKCY